jgi:hypothetical protein
MPDQLHPGIFISYRRDDSRGFAGRLYDRLAQRFDHDRVFMDVDSIEPGLAFDEAIRAAVTSCDVLLALIGPQWLPVGKAKNWEAEDPDDFVLFELKAALDREIRVIPVLVDGASMPRRDELPPSLAPLTRRNAIRLDHDSFVSDLERLVAAIERIVATRPSAERQYGRLPVMSQRAVSGEIDRTEDDDRAIADTNGRSDDRATPVEVSTESELARSDESSPWRALVKRVNKPRATLSIFLTLADRNHIIEVISSWRGAALRIDGEPAARSVVQVAGTHIFALPGSGELVRMEIVNMKVRLAGDIYGVERLTVDGLDVELSEESRSC